jgi:hypothetical protein
MTKIAFSSRLPFFYRELESLMNVNETEAKARFDQRNGLVDVPLLFACRSIDNKDWSSLATFIILIGDR